MDPRYPIGRFTPVLPATDAIRRDAIDTLAALPSLMREAVAGLNDAQLDTPYRAGGWTIRQLVHHVADSHMNGYIRTKLTLTENTPTIRPYDQDAWAALSDSALPIDISLALLDGIHARWVRLFREATSEQLARQYYHPELGSHVSLDEQLQTYAWHSRHHVAHVTAAFPGRSSSSTLAPS